MEVLPNQSHKGQFPHFDMTQDTDAHDVAGELFFKEGNYEQAASCFQSLGPCVIDRSGSTDIPLIGTLSTFILTRHENMKWKGPKIPYLTPR